VQGTVVGDDRTAMEAAIDASAAASAATGAASAPPSEAPQGGVALNPNARTAMS